MQSNALRRHHQVIVLALILLIHGGMLMTFVLVQFQSGSNEATVMMEQDESPMTENDWVAMNNSLPNTQYVAQDAPEQEQPQDPQEQQKVFEDPEPIELVEQQKAEQVQEKSEIVAQERDIDDAIAVASQLLDPQEAQEDEPEPQEIKEATKPFTQLANTATPMKATPTLAQLTQGFVEHLQQADMAVHSDRGGIASIDQIKHLNYCQKIIGCVVNSYKINNHTISQKVLAKRARIQLALNRNGSIARLSLQESSGDLSVDQFLIDMFRDASSSFPPVPAALQDEPYTLPSFSVDSLESFHSTQGWYIDNKSM